MQPPTEPGYTQPPGATQQTVLFEWREETRALGTPWALCWDRVINSRQVFLGAASCLGQSIVPQWLKDPDLGALAVAQAQCYWSYRTSWSLGIGFG